MTTDNSSFSTEAIAEEIRNARFVYGTILVGAHLNLVDCIDEAAFQPEQADRARSTAYASVGAQLIPLVTEHRDEIDLNVPTTAAPHLNEDFEMPRLTTFERTASVIDDARAYYVLINTADEEWKRIQNTVPERFDDFDSQVGRYLVSEALVETSSERIADLPDANPEDIDIIDWSG